MATHLGQFRERLDRAWETMTIRLATLFPRRPPPAAETPTEERLARLYLHVGPHGWRARVVKPGERPVTQPEGWDNPATDQAEESTRLFHAMRDVLMTLGEGPLREAERISILLDSGAFHFADDKHPLLSAASPATARLYGGLFLNSAETTFGFVNLESGGDRLEKEKGAYVFADAPGVRSLISLLDKHGLKVVEITPTPALFLPWAVANQRAMCGGLYVGAMESTLVLLNREVGILLSRTLPLGIDTLTRLVAERGGYSLSEARRVLAGENLLAPLRADMSERQREALNFEQQALQQHLAAFARELEETLDYFTAHKVGGGMPALEVLGEVERVQGLVEWMDRSLSLPVGLLSADPVRFYAEMAHPLPCNLLTGAEHSMLTVGRTRYYYSRQGFVRSQALALQAAAPVSRGTGEEPPAPPRAGSPEPSPSTPLALLLRPIARWLPAGWAPLGSEIMAGHPEQADTGSPEERRFFAIAVAVGCLVLFSGYLEHRAAAQRYAYNLRVYKEERSNADRLRREVGRPGGGDAAEVAAAPPGNLVFAEKFLSMGQRLEPSLRLTSVHLVQERREGVVGANAPVGRLVIQGRAPAADYMEKLSLFQQRLLEDRDGFMADVGGITFSGAEMDPASGGSQVRFTLEASLDPAKRRTGGEAALPPAIVPPPLQPPPR